MAKLRGMNLSSLHSRNKSLSTIPLLKGGEGTLISIHLEEGGELPEHITQVPAVLIAISGETTYSTEKGERLTLLQGDFVHIEPMVKHALQATLEAELVLMK